MGDALKRWLTQAVDSAADWQAQWEAVPQYPALMVSEERFQAVFAEFAERMRDNYPFFHPAYAGQMLKPPHPAAIASYVAAMLVNPNNHALDGGPATASMEKEAVAWLAAMFGFQGHLGHLTSSGTIANLEALFVAREIHPDRGIAVSEEGHYTHERVCHLLGLDCHKVATDTMGRMDLEALATALDRGGVGTVVLTAGTTALGAIDPIPEALQLARTRGVRVHVDAAYGGFFTTLAGDLLPAEPWRAIADCDSVVVDPHKHGLQPFGCGAVVFRDPAVGRFFKHDSPYTYFTSGDLHLGEISLECSRAGAAAAAVWVTLRLFPLSPDGLGAVLAPGLRAARRWADLLASSEHLDLYQQPELDIVTFFPRPPGARTSEVDVAAQRLFELGMNPAEPAYLSVLRVTGEALGRRHPALVADADPVRILRSVLMKPEAEAYLDRLHGRVERLAAEAV